jgi:hypothetical protein
MGIVNLVDLADLSFSVLKGNPPNDGTLSNVRDKDINTYYGRGTSPGANYSDAAYYQYVFTFNNSCFVTSIAVRSYTVGVTADWPVTYYYNNGNSDILIATSPPGYVTNTYTINSLVKNVTINQGATSYGTSIGLMVYLYEVSIYGPDIPSSKARAYKDGKVYSFGKDTDAVSPLYIGGERIAIGATNNPLATPFRFYWDGDTYSILRAQGV